MSKLRSIINSLKEEVELSGVISQDVLQKKLDELEVERNNLREEEVKEVQKLKEDIAKERDFLLFEADKFNEFKKKLEIADKHLDFQTQEKKNRIGAVGWAIAGGVLIIGLIIYLCQSINSLDAFSEMANGVHKKIFAGNLEILSRAIYFTYFKYIFTKLLFFSLLIYAIVFCVKNYNAQMHNHVINSHKANALKSTISLLNTARSDEGNDKLLLQATQAIFSHQQSGYNGKESEPNSPNLITNVVEAIEKKV